MRIPVQVLIFPVRKSNEDWEYLMLKRVKNRGGFWQGVTGAPENNETLSEGARRELYEETGYNPTKLVKTDISYIIPMEDKWKEIYPEGTKEIPEYLFIAKINESNPPKIDPIEHNDWKWCSFQEAMSLLTWDDNKRALEYVQKLLKDELNNKKK